MTTSPSLCSRWSSILHESFFYTKMILIHQSNQTFRFWIPIAFSMMVLALLFDICITYTLLVGAIMTASIALGPWIRHLLFRRWSETVPQFSLISYCANKWGSGATILIKLLPALEDKLVGLTYVSNKWFDDELRDFIFPEIMFKAGMAEDRRDAEEMYESRGSWVLRSLGGRVSDSDPLQFFRWTCDVEYDESLLLWHIATEILYQEDELMDAASSPLLSEKESKFRRISKTLADYMMYLLNRQPEIMLSVRGLSEVRYRETCAEASMFADRTVPKKGGQVNKEVMTKRFCQLLMAVNTDADPTNIIGNSVLFNAVQLAKSLTKVRERAESVGMWELIAKVWLELVSYTASHTRGSAHAAQLSQGEVLLTLLWLLMVQMGLVVPVYNYS